MSTDPLPQSTGAASTAPVPASQAAGAPQPRRLPRLVRTAVRPEDAERRARRSAVLGLLCLGLGLRVLLLPVAVHPDLLSVYDRVRLWFDGQFALGDFSFQALPILLHGLWAKLTGAGLPDLSGVPWPNPTEEQIFVEAGRVLSAPGQPGGLALLKLPYALADLAAGLLLARVVPARRALGVLALWMLHPVVLYVVGVFAKYEPFMLVPLFGGFLLMKRGRTSAGFVSVGIACAMRLYPFALVPAMVLAAGRTRRRRAELFTLSVVPTLSVLGAAALPRAGVPVLVAWVGLPLLLWLGWRGYRALAQRPSEWFLIAGGLAALVALTPRLTTALSNEAYPLSNLLHHVSFLHGDLFKTRSPDTLLLFLLAWGGVLAWAQARPGARRAGDLQARFDDTLDAGLLTALAFFSLSFFHPQYACLLIAVVVSRLHRLRDGALAHGLQVVGLLLMLLAFRDGNTTVRLFLPLAPTSILEFPPITDFLAPELADVPWPGVGRTLLTLAAIWMTVDLLRTRRAQSSAVLVPDPHPPLRSAFWLACALAWPAAALGYTALARGETLFARVGNSWTEELPWVATRDYNRLRFQPRMNGAEEADWIEIIPGRPGGSTYGAQAEVAYSKARWGGGPLEEVARTQIPRATLAVDQGRVMLPLEEFSLRSWLPHQIDVAMRRMEFEAQPTRLQLYRELTGEQLLGEARVEWRKRFLNTGSVRADFDAKPELLRAQRASLPLAGWWLGIPLLCFLAAGWLGVHTFSLTRDP